MKTPGRPNSTPNGQTTGRVAVMVAEMPTTAEDLVEDLGVSLTTAHYHLRKLVECRLATCRTDGLTLIYEPTPMLLVIREGQQ